MPEATRPHTDDRRTHLAALPEGGLQAVFNFQGRPTSGTLRGTVIPSGMETLGSRAHNAAFARDFSKRILPACRTTSLSIFSRTSQALKFLVFPNTTGSETWCPSSRISSTIQAAVLLSPGADRSRDHLKDKSHDQEKKPKRQIIERGKGAPHEQRER